MFKKLNVFALVMALFVGAGATFAQDEAEAEAVEPDKRFVLATIEGDYPQGPQGFLGVSGNTAGVINPTMRVNVGDVVEVILINGDGGTHDWAVPELDVASERVLRPDGIGSTVSVVFTVTEEGEFEYVCTIGNHRAEGMVGTFIVDPAVEEGE